MAFTNILRKLKGFLGIEYFKSRIPLSSSYNPTLKLIGNSECTHVYFFQSQVWIKTGRKKFELKEKSVCKFCKAERFDTVSTPR